MEVALHPHARDRIRERGATDAEVVATVLYGEKTPAKYGRVAFRRNFAIHGRWGNREYQTRQVEAIAVEEENRVLVITVIVRFF